MNDPSGSLAPSLRGVANLRTHRIPCAAGHDVVYGLARGGQGDIYLAASNEFSPGLCAMVYAFDVKSGKFRVAIDVQAATGFAPQSGKMPHSKVHLCLNAARDGRVFACTHFTAPGVGQTDFDPIAAYRARFDGCFFLEYRPTEDRVDCHGRLLAGEGARISCFDDVHQQYYFLSYPRNHLYRYDCRRRTLHDLGRMGQENSFGLEVDGDGNVYTSDDLGRIVVYDFARDRLEETDLFVPLAAGRRAAGNYIRRMTLGPDGCFYGFANKGVRLFRLDPRQRTLDDLGVIHGRERRDATGFAKLPPAKAVIPGDGNSLLVAFGGDGIYVDDEPVPSLVRYDLASGQVTELGKFISADEGLPAWIPQCGLCAPDLGAAFFGLQQTTGGLRLWEIPLGATAESSVAPKSEAYRDHVAVIARQPFGASVEGSNSLPFVKSGHVTMHELGWLGEDRTMPSGESAISALCFAGETLYGVTAGNRSRLFSYRPYQQNRFTENYEVHPWDLGIVEDAPHACSKVWHDASRGRLILATQSDAGFTVRAFAVGEERKHYRGVYHSLPHWPPVGWDHPPFSVLQHGARTTVRTVTFLADSGVLIWATDAGEFFCLGPGDAAARALPIAFPPALLAGLDANRFVAWSERGAGSVCAIGADRTITGVMTLPDLSGELTSSAAEAGGRRVVVGTGDGCVHLVSLEAEGDVRSIRLPRRWPVRALAWHPSGAVYGFYGEADVIGEAFAIEPDSDTVREIGILQAPSQPRFWICHRCDAIAVGPRGEVDFGEHDRISHLFTFRETAPSAVRPHIPS